MRQRLPFLLALIALFLFLFHVPAAWFRRGAGDWMEGKAETQLRLARTVAREIGTGLTAKDYKTGFELFDGEWLFGTHMMAGVGLCQVVAQHPETAAEFTPVIDQCIRQLLSEPVRRFDAKAWDGSDALASLDTNQGHAAYLGYLNFLLSLYRQIKPDNEFAALNDRLTATLVRRFEASPIGLIETYPTERYPVDNSPGIASIALHGKATGRDYSKLLAREESLLRQRYLDPQTRLLYQSVNRAGEPRDLPRGSGTALGIFFLHRAYPELAREMLRGIRRHLVSSLFNFGVIREYPHGMNGPTDIDSGPIIFGFGFSATGFTISAARAYGDASLFARLYSSAMLAGAPVQKQDEVDFLTAGPLGNAILLAMFTTPALP